MVWKFQYLGIGKQCKTVNKQLLYHRQRLKSTQCCRCVFAGNPNLTDKVCGVTHPGIFWLCGRLQILLHLPSHYRLVFTHQNPSQSTPSFLSSLAARAESLRLTSSCCWTCRNKADYFLKQATAAFILTSSVALYLFDSTASGKPSWGWQNQRPQRWFNSNFVKQLIISATARKDEPAAWWQCGAEDRAGAGGTDITTERTIKCSRITDKACDTDGPRLFWIDTLVVSLKLQSWGEFPWWKHDGNWRIKEKRLMDLHYSLQMVQTDVLVWRWLYTIIHTLSHMWKCVFVFFNIYLR